MSPPTLLKRFYVHKVFIQKTKPTNRTLLLLLLNLKYHLFFLFFFFFRRNFFQHCAINSLSRSNKERDFSFQIKKAALVMPAFIQLLILNIIHHAIRPLHWTAENIPQILLGTAMHLEQSWLNSKFSFQQLCVKKKINEIKTANSTEQTSCS